MREPTVAGVIGGVGSAGNSTPEGERLGLGIDVLDDECRGVELDFGVAYESYVVERTLFCEWEVGVVGVIGC